MCKPSQYINDICYECNPQTYDVTLAKFIGQENLVEASNPDDSFIEYLYECCLCGSRVWVDEDWVKRNAIAEESLEKFTNLKGDDDMILTEHEKDMITNMKQDDFIRFDDKDKSLYQYEVEKPSQNEYRVSKFAIMCLAVEYFESPEDVIKYIERN